MNGHFYVFEIKNVARNDKYIRKKGKKWYIDVFTFNTTSSGFMTLNYTRVIMTLL